MSTTQIAVRLPAHLLTALDDMVATGAYESRAAAVRASVETMTAQRTRQAIDQAIIEGYRRVPATTSEMRAAEASLRHSIREEPW